MIIIFFIIISLIIWYFLSKSILEKWALIVIIAGAISNFVDRLIHESVTDFIYFHYNQYYFPAFNIADIAISMGVVIMIIATYMTYKYKVINKNE